MADVWVMRSGGRIEGEWINRTAPAAEPYHVRTAAGSVVAVQRRDVETVVSQRPDEVSYQRLAPTVPDTVEAQWKLALWCRDHHLDDERATHLQRILELNPEHVEARRALGYTQVGGQWMTSEEFRAKRGLERHQGRWRLPQDVALMEAREQQEDARRHWTQRIRTLREMLETDKAVEARDQLLAIREPAAVGPLNDFLVADPARLPKLMYIETLGQIGNDAAARALVAASLRDPDEEVRVAALEQVERLDPPGVTTAYVKALLSTDNFTVNRAAYALGRAGDRSAVAPLIEALVTRHTFTFEPPTSSGGQTITTSFMNDQRAAAAAAPPLVPRSGSGLSMGASKKTIVQDVPNRDVHAALMRLTAGPNYGYNKAAWRQWLESQQHAAAVNARDQ